nr:uncharacterized protein LOC111503376 isoform X2 [Leptinotarsa decemlineata]
MYIRALTSDMNELERQKDGNETEKATATTSRLAEAFCNLADFLDEHVKVARECVLTAFSLEPTKERLAKIETLARRSGFQVLDTGQEWKCKLHPPVLPTDEVTWICPECGDWMSKPDFNAPIKINMALNEALQNSVLGISEALCDDLVVCLSNPRYQILSWFLPWDDLHRLCIMYSQDSQTTKNFVTELKFVDIDYSIFKGIKREPMDELAGIERGYEQYLDHDFVSDDDSSSNSEDSMSQDSRPYSLGSDGAGEGPHSTMLLPQTKSDPNTLKSLRMFRPSLKRSRDKELDEVTPKKLFKTDPKTASDSSTMISSGEMNTKTNTNDSLSHFLNSVSCTDLPAIQYPPSSISSMDKSNNNGSHSKNVKTATLPRLGGQVAKKEITTIQVNKQRPTPSLQKKGLPSLSINLIQAIIPQKQCAYNSKMATAETHPSQKSQNKLSLNFLRESNRLKKAGSKCQDFSLVSQKFPLDLKQNTDQKQTSSSIMRSCPKKLSVKLERLRADQIQSMMRQKLQNKLSETVQRSEKMQPPQITSQSTQYLGQSQVHKSVSPEKQEPNENQFQNRLDSPPNLDLSPVALVYQEKLPNKPFGPRPFAKNPLDTAILEMAIVERPLLKSFTQTSQVLTSPTKKNTSVSNQPQEGNLIHQQDLDSAQCLSVKQDQIQKTKLPPPTPLKSMSPKNSRQVQDSMICQSHLKHSVNLEQSQATQVPQTLKNRSSQQEQIPNESVHQPILEQKQNSVVKQEQSQTTQLLSTPKLICNSPQAQKSIQDNSLHHPNLDQKPNHSIKKDQLPKLHQSQPLTCPEVSHTITQTFDCTKMLNLSKQLSTQKVVEQIQKPLESYCKEPQKQPIQETPLVNSYPALQKLLCNSVHIPSLKKPLAQEEVMQTSCSLQPQKSESNCTQSPKLEQTKNQQANQKEVLENQRPFENKSKCFNQDLNQLSSLENVKASLPVRPLQSQSIPHQVPHTEDLQSQMITKENENCKEMETCQEKKKPQKKNSVQHISLGQEPIVKRTKLETNHISCQQQFPNSITSLPQPEPPQRLINQQQPQENLIVSSTCPKSNFDQSCKVKNNLEKQMTQPKEQVSPNQNQLQNNSCSLPKAPSLSLNSDKLQTSKSIKNHPKISSKQNLDKASVQMTPNQNVVSLVCPKVGKVPCTPTKSNQNISMEAEVLPNLDRFQPSCTRLLNPEIESHSLDKLQARLWPGLEQADKVMVIKSQEFKEVKAVDKTTQTSDSKESPLSCLEHKKNSCTSSEIMERNEYTSKCDKIVAELEEILKCNKNEKINVMKNDSNHVVKDESLGNLKIASKLQITYENWKDVKTTNGGLEQIAQSKSNSVDWLEVTNGIFSDLSENKSEELLFQSGMDHATSTESAKMIKNSQPLEELPKNFNLTENIRTYTKKSRKALLVVNKDCIKALTGDDVLNFCKNVNNINKLHSNVQNSLTNSKELKIILCRLSSNKKMTAKTMSNNKEEYCSIKNKCDRGKTPPKNSRKRWNMDKSENNVDGKAPNSVQNHGLSPLQDINLRTNPRVHSKVACCELNVSNTTEDLKAHCTLTEQNSVSKKNLAKTLLANVPGLNDFRMMKPLNVDQIVNVVQVSGGRPTQNVPIQNSQTSTQITPHIQRIGQPRISSDQKPEHSNSVTVTTNITTTTTARTTTSQPSTLINILSQQIIRPTSSQANTLRRQAPLINILSQQIIRPSSTAKTTNNTTVPVAETNQVKPVITSEPTVINPGNNAAKNSTSTVKNTNSISAGQGGTILQFICKSSLPKFQQAFGKTVYQNSAESPESVAATTDTTANVTDIKNNVSKAVPVNVQPIQGSVIYSRQVPVGQTISLIPPGGTTRQVFRIATSNPDQISLVKDSVIHSKMSALLAAALQGRQKNAEGELQVNCDEGKGAPIARPALMQSARIVKPVQLHVQSNATRATPQTNLSSTTLEQLREFDMVYKQVTERSSTTTSETGSVTSENQEVTQQRISVTYVNQLQKYTPLSPVVVVPSYSNLQPAASPALSVTSQGSSSPSVTPASTPTLPKMSTKTSKGKTLKSSPNNTTPKSSPIPKPQQKPQEDEHTAQRIFNILAEYAEQLRNSPDLNNKPAPRRRSNPPTNPSQNSKRKKSSSGVKKSGNSSNSLEMDVDDITMGSEDSSGGGMVQLSVTDDEQSQAATINTTESSDNSSPPSSRPLILTESGTCGTPSRNLIIADSSVGESLKIPNTTVIMPGSYIVPVSMVKESFYFLVMKRFAC